MTVSPFLKPSSADPPAIDDAGVKRDHFGRYLLPPPDDLVAKERPWTRATTFAGSMRDEYLLARWGERMAIKGMGMRDDLWQRACETPLSNKAYLNDLVEQAKTAAGAHERASLGTELHTMTAALDLGIPLSPLLARAFSGDLAAYQSVMTECGFLVDEVERIVVNPRFEVAGTLDRIVTLTKNIKVYLPGDREVVLSAGDQVVLDLKTGANLDLSWGEIVVQLALYVSATHMWQRAEETYVEMPNVRQDIAIVLHLPYNVGHGAIYMMDIQRGLEAAELCTKVRAHRASHDFLLAHWIDQSAVLTQITA